MKYDHAYDIAFSIESDHPNGDDVTENMLYQALRKRISEAYLNGELIEAVGMPFDTYEISITGEELKKRGLKQGEVFARLKSCIENERNQAKGVK